MPDAIRETDPLLLVPVTLIPRFLVPRHRIAAGVSDGAEAVSRDAAVPFTTTTVTDITIHVIASQNGHTDRGVGRPQDAKREISEKSATSTGESVMIEGFPESMTLILAQQVLQNPDYGHWTHTEARVPLI